MVVGPMSVNFFSITCVALKSHGHRAFSYGTVVKWNRLRLKIKQSPSADVFKSRLKTYLFEMCYY